ARNAHQQSQSLRKAIALFAGRQQGIERGRKKIIAGLHVEPVGKAKSSPATIEMLLVRSISPFSTSCANLVARMSGAQYPAATRKPDDKIHQLHGPGPNQLDKGSKSLDRWRKNDAGGGITSRRIKLVIRTSRYSNLTGRLL